jgi:transcription antitermination factor NusG
MSWYALHVRSQCERQVLDGLTRQSLSGYLPVYTERTRWSDRTKMVERALFPGYVFGRLDLSAPGVRRHVVALPGLVRILGIGAEPAPIPDEEIERVRMVVTSGLRVAPVPYLANGQKVRVERGSLAGVEGIVVRVKNELRVVVSVEILRRSVMAELDTDALAPVTSLKQAA